MRSEISFESRSIYRFREGPRTKLLIKGSRVRIPTRSPTKEISVEVRRFFCVFLNYDKKYCCGQKQQNRPLSIF
nr:MAG TPA: hypothetical protein [Caudoviricetes sp.]